MPDACKQMSSTFLCNLKIENSTFSCNQAISLIFFSFSIVISALFIVLIKLKRKPFTFALVHLRFHLAQLLKDYL